MINYLKPLKRAGMAIWRYRHFVYFGINVVGSVLAPISAVKNAPVYERLMMECQPKTKWERFLVWLKAYWPTALIVTAEVAGEVGLFVKLGKDRKDLAGLLAASEAFAKKYQDKVIENMGEDKEKRIRDSVAEEMVSNSPTPTTCAVIGDGEILCYDTYSSRYFKMDIEELRHKANDFQYYLNGHLNASANDWYRMLDNPDLQPIGSGDDVGLDCSDKFELYFTSTLVDGRKPCLVVNYETRFYPKFTEYRGKY